MIDLTSAVIVHPPELSRRERTAVDMLCDEVERRTLIRPETMTEWPERGTPVIALVPAADASLFCAGRIRPDGEFTAAEGFRVRCSPEDSLVCVIGNDERGFLYGIGYLLRSMRLERGTIAVRPDIELDSAPRYRLRGHQIGYRDKVNSYDGWDLPQWEQYIRDLAVFGANAVEMIPPRSDDRETSVHFPRPPLEILAGVSRIADDYGIDVWLWYPALDKDYSDQATVEFALQEWAEVFSVLPRLDAVLVPGGDPGRTPPRLLFPMLEKQAARLKTIHPNAAWWISPQGFTADEMDDFVDLLGEDGSSWLTGVVHGPWIHTSMADFRKLIPDRYPIRNYPDITHSLNCQYPVPEWDIAYALTIGREPCNPRPVDQAAVFRASQPPTIGFLTYCEGCHDDVNKAVWSGLGWDPETPVIDILREYGRYFIGWRHADDFAQGLLALELNWRGPLAVNGGVMTTLRQFKTMEESVSPWTLKNWRFLQALYRAYYDAYTRVRLIDETALEERAMQHLREAGRKGSIAAMDEARRILDRAVHEPAAGDLRTRIFQLAEALFQSPAHVQLSVHLYRGQEEVRGANLDGVDFPLNNRPWLEDRFEAIRNLPEEKARLEEIRRIVDWTNPGPGGFYVDLGGAVDQPHVVEGQGYADDPAFLASPQHRYPYRKDPAPIRLSWRGFTGPLNDAPFRMRFTHLDPSSHYAVRIVYSDINPQIKVRLTGNGREIHPWIVKPSPRRPVEFPVPGGAIESGELLLEWRREPGRGHSGIGCEVSELWICKTEPTGGETTHV